MADQIAATHARQTNSQPRHRIISRAGREPGTGAQLAEKGEARDECVLPVWPLAIVGAFALLLSSCINLTDLTWQKIDPVEFSEELPRDPEPEFRLEEREVEVPEAFHRIGMAVWDGSDLSDGIWVAHPAAVQPERVSIRNISNGRSVVGDLYGRDADSFEKEPDGATHMLLSAAAARVLGVAPNMPSRVEVTVIRREIVNVPMPEPGGPSL